MIPNKDYPFYLKIEYKVEGLAVVVEIRASTDDFVDSDQLDAIVSADTVEEAAKILCGLVIAPEAEVIVSNTVGARTMSAYAVKTLPVLPISHPKIFAEASLG